MSWSREKQELRRKICQAARQIAQAGYVAANDGNLSARCSDGGVLISPSGVYKGDLEEDMLLEVDGGAGAVRNREALVREPDASGSLPYPA